MLYEVITDLYVSDGFINVSVSGTTIRDSVVNMSFLADKYAKSDMSTASIYIPVDRDQDYYTFKVFRSEDYTKSKYFKFQITVIGVITSYSIHYTKLYEH